jgi:hypothetical protein
MHRREWDEALKDYSLAAARGRQPKRRSSGWRARTTPRGGEPH